MGPATAGAHLNKSDAIKVKAELAEDAPCAIPTEALSAASQESKPPHTAAHSAEDAALRAVDALRQQVVGVKAGLRETDALRREVARLQAALATVPPSNPRAASRARELAALAARARDGAQSVQSAHAAVQAAFGDLRRGRERLRTERESIRLERALHRAEMDTLQSQLESAEARAADAEAELARLERGWEEQRAHKKIKSRY